MTGRREEETKEHGKRGRGEVKEKGTPEEQEDETRVLCYKERGRQVRRTWHRDTSRVTFLFSKVPGRWTVCGEVGPNDAISDPGGPYPKNGASSCVDKANPVRPVDCRSSPSRG